MTLDYEQGDVIGKVSFPIERSKLKELSRAFKDDEPVWFDPAAAAAAGFEDVPVPPTATAIADHWRARGATELGEALGIDLERVLHGEVSWAYLRPLRIGDQLTATSRLLGSETREGKRGGEMLFIRLETEYRDRDDLVVARRFDTIIERGAE